MSVSGAHLDTVAVWLPLPARHERGEGWGEGIFNLQTRGLLSPALSSSEEEREKNCNGVKMHPFR